MQMSRSLLLTALLVFLFGSGSSAQAAVEKRDLVVVPQSAQETLVAHGIPVTSKGASFFLAEWDTKQQAAMKDLGVGVEVILRDVRDEDPLFLFELHEGEEPPPEWTGRLLYRQGLNVILLMKDVEAQEWALKGGHPVRLSHKAHGWGRPAGELVPYTCTYNAIVASLLGKTTQPQWVDWIEKLSGMEPVDIGGTSYTIATRYTSSMFGGATNAKGYDFVKQQAQAWSFNGARLEEDPFSIGPSGKNLVLTIPGQTTPASEVLLTAHLDSISGGSSTTMAPGANDNGTGSATLLEAARILRQYRFERTIRIIFFTGEEQGLYGSWAYTQDHSMSGILGVLNLDMFGYDLNGDRCFEIHIGTLPQSLDVGNCFNASIGSYGLGLSRDFLTSGATDRSDHKRFWDVGVGAIEIAENFFSNAQPGGCVGSEANPGYHQTTDTLAQNMHPSYALDIAKTALATISAMAIPMNACFTSSPTLSASPGTNQVDLSWTAVPSAASYRIYRSRQGCGGTFVSIGETAATTYADTAVTAATYAYRVEAMTADGQCFSAESNCVTETPTVYHAKATSASYLDSCPGGGPGDANGFVDPGETVTLQVTVQNDGNTNLTSLSGTLSSTTPGVGVADPSAGWPDLGPGASSSTLPDHFRFEVSPSVACGTILSLEVGTTAAEGSWTDTFPKLVASPTSATNTSQSTDVPKPIVDYGTATSIVTVTTAETVLDVNVGLSLTHTYDADLDLFLRGPDGTRVELSSDNGGNGDNYTNTVFDDEAATSVLNGGPPYTGSFRPEFPLSAFDGRPAAGTWTLEVRDEFGQDTGSLSSWSLTLTTSSTPVCNVCPEAVGPPGEAGASAPVLLSKNGNDLVIDWGAPPNSCTPAGYAVYRGDLSTLAAATYSHDTALVCAATSPTFQIALDDASLGDAAYFIVTADNGVDEGSYGRDTEAAERPVSAAACKPAQDLAVCP